MFLKIWKVFQQLFLFAFFVDKSRFTKFYCEICISGELLMESGSWTRKLLKSKLLLDSYSIII